jgi:chromosome partitioning protein
VGSIIAICSSKGGVGKTTLTTTLAVNLAAVRYRVAVCDADRNQAFAVWHKTTYDGPPLTVSSEIDHNKIVSHLMKLAEDFDVVLADTAGFENQTAVFAMGAADLVLIPCMADRNSVLEARKTAAQVASIGQIARRSIPYRLLLSRWNPRGLSEQATLADIDASDLPRLKQHIPDLVAFQKSTFSGVVPISGLVGIQIDRIIKELVELEALPAKPQEKAA